MNPYKENITLGILGGLGPMSSAYFYELITKHTYAERDQDHIDIILSSRATTPDRTAYILDDSNAELPISVIVDGIVIVCNNSHE